MSPQLSESDYRILTADDIDTQVYILEKSIQDINNLPKKARESPHFINELETYKSELKALDAVPEDYKFNESESAVQKFLQPFLRN